MSSDPHQSPPPTLGFREQCGGQQGAPEDQQCRGGALAELSPSSLLSPSPPPTRPPPPRAPI